MRYNVNHAYVSSESTLIHLDKYIIWYCHILISHLKRDEVYKVFFEVHDGGGPYCVVSGLWHCVAL